MLDKQRVWRLAQFIAAYVGAFPLAYWIDSLLVNAFGRAYWALPRELFLILGWPLLSGYLAFVCRDNRFRWLTSGAFASGVTVLALFAAYMALIYSSFLFTK